MVNNYKKKLIFLACIIVITLCCAFILNNKKAKLMEKSNMKKNSIAIYVKSNGSYIRYNNSTFPTGKTLNTANSVCLNNNGDVVPITLSASSNRITFTTGGTVYCTLYFD